MPVAVKGGVEPLTTGSNGQPPCATGPRGGGYTGGIAVGFIEVQRQGQFVAVAALTADHVPRVGWERGGVYPGVIVCLAVAVEVVANRVQLFQIGDLDEAVSVGVFLSFAGLGVEAEIAGVAVEISAGSVAAAVWEAGTGVASAFTAVGIGVDGEGALALAGSTTFGPPFPSSVSLPSYWEDPLSSSPHGASVAATREGVEEE